MNDFPVHTKEIIGYTFLKRVKNHKIYRNSLNWAIFVAVTYPVTNIISHFQIIADSPGVLG